MLAYGVVALGGAFGAVCRYAVFMAAQALWGLRFPYATLIVNSSGSFLAGFFLAFLSGRWSGTESIRLLLFTGVLGAYTTFSSFAAETLLMFEHGQWLKAFANIALNNMGALAMVYIGWYCAKLLNLS